jgi:hypothetical protein
VQISGSVALVTGAGRRSRFSKASLSRDHELIYPPIEEFWTAAVTGTS